VNSGIAGADRWREAFTKLLVFNMTKFSKIVYYDSDFLLMKNVDDLFEKTEGFEFSAVRDMSSPQFNAGMFVLKPSRDLFEELMVKMLQTNSYDTRTMDQGFLNWYYGGKWNELPYEYNAQFFSAIDKIGTVRAIHDKFWDEEGWKNQQVRQKWFDVLEEMNNECIV